MGMPLLVILLLLALACVAVRPRTNAVLYGTLACLGVLAVLLAAAMQLGYVSWGWQAGR